MDALTYRTVGAWGAGYGADLPAVEIDLNFWRIFQAVGDLETAIDGVAGAVIQDITGDGASMTITMSDSSTFVVAMPAATNAPPPVVTETGTGLVTLTRIVNQGSYTRATDPGGVDFFLPSVAIEAWDLDAEMHFRVAPDAGAISWSSESGVVINPVKGFMLQSLAGSDGGTFTLKHVATDEWDLIGGPLEPEVSA